MHSSLAAPSSVVDGSCPVGPCFNSCTRHVCAIAVFVFPRGDRVAVPMTSGL